MLSITRQTYSLLGRFEVLDLQTHRRLQTTQLDLHDGNSNGSKFFEYIPFDDNTIKTCIDAKNLLNEIKDWNENTNEKKCVYFIPGTDLLMGSFAYPSSLLEQQL
jgi:hypothetical protein